MSEKSSRLKDIFGTSIALLCTIWFATAFAYEPAADFSLPTDQGEITLSHLQGQVVYLDFWASWCGPCRKSFPWMNELSSRYKNLGLKIIAINLDTDRGLSDKFLKQYHADFTIAYNPEGDVAESYHVMGMPSSYLIDRQGRIHAVHIGFRESEKARIEAEISALLKQD